MIGDAAPLGPIGHLLYQATLQDKETWQLYLILRKQTQSGRLNENTRKHVPNERTKQNSRKKKGGGTSKLLDSEFKRGIIRMLHKLRERVDKFSDNFNRDRKNKNGGRKYFLKESEMNNTII